MWTKALGRAHELPFGSIMGHTYGISGTHYTIKQGFRKNLRSKDFLGKGATAQKSAPPKGGADKRASCDAVGYTFRRHKLRFMSNAKLRTTTFLRYGSSSQKSAAHIFGNPDCILLPVCFQRCARLWRTDLLITCHYLTSQKTTK